MKLEQLGPYRIVRTLGRGGMGAVYEGIHVDTDEPAAIKILSGALAEEPDFRQRFEAEIETLKKLYHPNIVQLFGFGEQDEYLFYAMELVDGNSLEEELRRGRFFDWREVARIGIETCRALRHAHDRGVIHRDIKPANLLVSADGRVKLSDFGIARLFGNTRLTAAGNVLGTAEYMAPEQAEGRPVGPRTDLYSLGAVLYCLSARRPPFRAGSLPEMLQKHRTAQPDPVRRHAPDTPAELEHIILQLLEKDPEKRIANATLLARRLEAMVRALSIQATTREGRLLEQLAGQLDEGPLTAPDRPREEGSSTTRAQTDRQASPPEAAEAQGAQTPEAVPRVPGGRTSTHVSGAAPGAKRGAGPGELPETRATDAFQAYAGAGPSAAASGRTGSARFVVVGEKELDAVETPQARHAALISIQTWILAAALVALGLTVWYFLQPPSADVLYDRITAATADKSIDSLLGAERTIQEFLIRYAGDSRCPSLREQVREIELYRLERTFDRRAKGQTKSEDLLPIERAYVEAINYAALDPHKGLARLQALVDLYQDRTDPSGPAGRCLELARRRCLELRRQAERMAADGRAELEDRLQRADEIAATHPAAARSMWQGLVDFYQDKPWAVEAVAQARAKLAGRN